MVDQDSSAILHERDTTKIGKYLIQERAGFQHAEMEAKMRQNLQNKKKMRDKMTSADDKAKELGIVEGEDEKMKNFIVK